MEQETLVAIRVDDPEYARQNIIPGTSFDRVCSECGRHVAIAPTGQRRLKQNPKMPIVCKDCLPGVIARDPNASPVEFRLAGTRAEILAEVRAAHVPSITCPRCSKTSHNPRDVENGYCGFCHWFIGDGPV